jgi:hypothetical protein
MTPTAAQIAQVEQVLEIAALAFAATGVLLTIFGLARIAGERGWTGGARRTTGTVVDQVAFPAGSRTTFPVVRFFDESGRRLDHRSVRTAPDLRPGDIADVVYVPDGDTWVRPRVVRFGCGPVGVAAGAGMAVGGVSLFRWILSIIATVPGH